MTESEHHHVRLAVASVVPAAFFTGVGGALLTMPFYAADILQMGWLGIGFILLGPIASGLMSVIAMLVGFPAYMLYASRSKGHRVWLVHVGSAPTDAQQGAPADGPASRDRG